MIQKELISRLLNTLQAVPSTELMVNPYQNPDYLNNLFVYLQALSTSSYSGHLLIGEAPGYRGCALTGVPFTSPRILRSHPHPFLENLRGSLLISGDTAESTATIVWSTLQNRSMVPAFWNVFPFHPHQAGIPTSNRPPKRHEREMGRPFLDLMLEILSPQTLVAVGRVAEKAIKQWYPDKKQLAVRHPSHGGKSKFVTGLAAAGII